MKTIRLLVVAWSHWLLIDKRSERFFNWALGVLSSLFFGSMIIRFLIQNL
jgi:hypothetical protein